MKYSNVKSGLKTLYIAELLTIASGFSAVFNGEQVLNMGLVLSLLGAVAFIINFKGLKRCARDDAGYKKAYNISVFALLLCFGIVVLGAVKEDTVLANSANEVQGVLNYIVAYIVLKTTASVLRNNKKEAEAIYADKVKRLYTFAFVVSEAFGIVADYISGNVMVAAAFVVAAIAVVSLLIAQIKYIVFLKKSSDAL